MITWKPESLPRIADLRAHHASHPCRVLSYLLPCDEANKRGLESVVVRSVSKYVKNTKTQIAAMDKHYDLLYTMNRYLVEGCAF
jgi:hypothetical protein